MTTVDLLDIFCALFAVAGIFIAFYPMEQAFIAARKFALRPEHLIVPESRCFFFDFLLMKRLKGVAFKTAAFLAVNFVAMAAIDYWVCSHLQGNRNVSGYEDLGWASLGQAVRIGLQCTAFSASGIAVALGTSLLLAPMIRHPLTHSIACTILSACFTLSAFFMAFALQPALPAQEVYDPPYTQATSGLEWTPIAVLLFTANYTMFGVIAFRLQRHELVSLDARHGETK